MSTIRDRACRVIDRLIALTLVTLVVSVAGCLTWIVMGGLMGGR